MSSSGSSRKSWPGKGKASERTAAIHELLYLWRAPWDIILTDTSGPFFTVVTEEEVESLAEWERRIAEIFAMPEFGDWFARMIPLVESGRREFYNIET
ncbi:MAG: hypothetical protein GTN71_26595 [Anaerolineae bacterium]|nr:hypothetical protein [Anaerolineae bacterium]